MLLSVIALAMSSCTDERALVVTPDNFQVMVSGYQKLLTDTIVINVKDELTFSFPDGCPDEILFYSGESKKEYRFANRQGLYRIEDGTQFESKVIINTVINTNSFDASVARSYSLYEISGMGNSTPSDFQAATKILVKSLRTKSATLATALADTLTINQNTSPVNLYVGNINWGIVSKSADATKNMLSVTGFTVTNTEIRDYGYSQKGLTVVKKDTITYPVIAAFADASWAQNAPDSTIAPNTTRNLLNATGYSWNTGEIGVSYAPSITGGTVAKNKNGLALATAYPISITVPADASKVVTAGSSPCEAWLICKPVDPSYSVLSPTLFSDSPVVVKKVDQSSMKYYQYFYKDRGIYKVTFVGLNVGTNGTAKVVREFVILVKNSTDNL